MISPTPYSYDEKEALDLIWRLTRDPDNIKLCQWVLAVKVSTMASLRLRRAIVGAPPKLTEIGRIVLRNYRTCYDCHQEILEVVHDCPARRKPHPYRFASR